MGKRVKKRKTKTQKMWTFIKIQIVLIIIVASAITYYYVGGYANSVTKMKNEATSFVANSTEETFRSSQTSMAYDTNGELISVLKGEKDKYYIGLDDTPQYVKDAFVSIEDKKFYDHRGLDYKGMARAFVAMIRNRKISGGGSTITQQLARNVFLSNEKTWQRKIEEIYIASQLEQKYSKDQILEFYLNNIYFANGYYGIEAAAKGYFNRDISELSLSEIAFLAAIPNNPTMYDPINNFDSTIKRRNTVLKEMLEDKKISKDSYNEAIKYEIKLESPDEVYNDYDETFIYSCATKALMKADGFEFKNEFKSESDKVKYQNTYNEEYSKWNQLLFTGGYRIYTSIDMDMQNKLQSCLDSKLAPFTEVGEDGIYTLQGSAVCIENSTGMVKAIVGGRSQQISGYTLNRAFQSYRQPGSAIKPLVVYTPALERGYTANSIVYDGPIENGPKNSDGTYSGNITLRRAVETSKNTVAYKLFDEIGPSAGMGYLIKMGFNKIDSSDYHLASALGGFRNGVSALEMAKGYATIENDGLAREATCIQKITDSSGNVIFENDQVSEEIYKESAARQMTDILQSVMTSGTAASCRLANQACAGKTGTTNDNKDGWFVGYTSYYTTSVWVGYDMPKELEGLFGSTYPGAIWKDYMTQIHTGLEKKEFLQAQTFIGEN